MQMKNTCDEQENNLNDQSASNCKKIHRLQVSYLESNSI